ncbi:hypothetical protein P3102_29245 [Amycolatopsis sp. QT-25]|uniref:hypothetical protein n=1 Tax=Amycolatopsis sp. QT-25 TaxID=3034022 RepID=UPI0023EB4FD3|nr:hypothetical protein [Amycolatopsis sp. QT-25]WET78120.1 hypothetical protein P3102_29245 [Amycolatopsis sp. QT-25]
MPEQYSTNARAALLALVLANRDMRNTELVKDHKVRLSPAERVRLNDAGLLESSTDVRPFVHRITDEGIDWCLTDLVRSELPSRSGPQARQQLDLLRRLVPFLRQRGLLAEALRSGDLESLIRGVYAELSVGVQDWIRLARLRPKLNGADKDEVDAVLVEMTKTGTVHLAPDSNRKVLTDADHDAAVRVGGEDKHLIVIEES